MTSPVPRRTIPSDVENIPLCFIDVSFGLKCLCICVYVLLFIYVDGLFVCVCWFKMLFRFVCVLLMCIAL